MIVSLANTEKEIFDCFNLISKLRQHLTFSFAEM